MNIYLEDAKARAEQRLRSRVQTAQDVLDEFLATGRDISQQLNPPVNVNMRIARWTNLKLASKRLAPEGFTPELMLDKWPVLADDLRVKATVSPDTRYKVLQRDKLCSWCGVEESTTVDHVIPRARGGSNRQWNLVGSCRACNEFKSDFVPKELGWRLRLSLRAYETGGTK